LESNCRPDPRVPGGYHTYKSAPILTSAPTIAAFRDAPEDDEAMTAADEEALAEVEADRAAGVPRISLAEMTRTH